MDLIDLMELRERVQWQHRIAWEVVCSSMQAREQFQQQRSAVWVTRARSAGLRQRAALVRGQSIATRLGFAGEAPWGTGCQVSR